MLNIITFFILIKEACMLIISRGFLYSIFLLIAACVPSLATHLVTPINNQAVILKRDQTIISNAEQTTIKTKQSWLQVTVKYLSLEGGFYGLLSEKGDKLLPLNLPEKYRVDGTILRVKGQPIKNMFTIQQWGTPFKVIDIELIKIGIGKKSLY